MKTLSDIATEAHTRIQKNCADINPIVGVNQGMRASGFPADVMTIDCLKTNKRIILILHDDMPKQVRYQFSYRDQDPAQDFKDISLEQVSVDVLYQWIKEYFSSDA
jgi:hypothetical protein